MLPSLALASLMSSPDSDFASDSKSLFIIEISITTKFYKLSLLSFLTRSYEFWWLFISFWDWLRLN
ncbi:hypothetical protein RchiOBHm_Chr1g0373161 [Rosa chinensis]|uniref:Uncharacterized protein n=1 Tax=Rosa chinensis TaxID=74649 RepID=A0A2P6SM08_ROSCH|nr:hypothetical protein RchiOBHm_Chr1g0373161 [Rosa chinensis]